MGVDHTVITRWLSGDRPIPRNHWRTIEDVLGKPPLTLTQISGEYGVLRGLPDPIAVWDMLHPREGVRGGIPLPNPGELSLLEAQLAELQALVISLTRRIADLEDRPPEPRP